MSQHGTVPATTFGDYGAQITNNDVENVESNYELCMRSGFKTKPRTKGALIKEWNGLWVRPSEHERRHPQEYVRGTDERVKGSPRPELDDVFLSVNEVKASEL